MLTPNLSEAQTLSGLESADPEDLASALRRTGVGGVVVTMGEGGACIVDRDGARVVPAYRVTAVDTTGAGDAFSGALAVSVAEGANLDEAVSFGCAAGGYSVRSLGTVPSYATRSQLASFVSEQQPVAAGGVR